MNRPIAPASVSRRVLVVEDEPHLRSMLLDAITDMHFEPSGVGSAEAALRAMQKEDFDILVLDLNLPGANGMELVESLQTRSPRPQVIIHTGFGDLAAARQALRLDVVDFLAKPCALSELETALERARNRRLQEQGEALPSVILDEPVETCEPASLPRQSSQAVSQPSHLPSSGSAPSASHARPAGVTGDESVPPLSLEQLEREHILATLSRNGGNRAATASQLGISIRKLYYRLEEYQRRGYIR